MDQGAAGRCEDRRAGLVRAAAAAAARAGRQISLEPLEAALSRLPCLEGRGIRVRIIADPHAHDGRLLSGGGRGQEVHAGSRIPAREMVLDLALLDRPREFARIFLHEVFHFVWVRLGNPVRQSYETLLLKERCVGELGWSAEMRKVDLEPGDIEGRTSRWRDYACESFCDTGAWFCTSIPKHPECTLPRNARDRRRRWFTALLSREGLRF